MEQAKELLIKHLKALPIGYNETEMLQCLNDKKSEEGMLLNAMLNAVTEALNIHGVSGSLPPRHPFIDALVENTECAARDEGIYFADSIRDNEERTDWFNKMIEDYQRQ